MTNHGFVRVAAAVPALRVADYVFNVERILGLLARAQDEDVAVVVFTELCLTGYTCADLFHQMVGLAVVGLPLVVDDRLFNCAAVFQEGRVLGIVPKSHIRPGCVCIRAQRDTSRFR